MLTCKELIEDYLDDYFDEGASPTMTVELVAHLAACRPCIAYLNTYRKTRDMVGKAGPVAMPPEMKSLLHRFLMERLGEIRI